MLLKIKSFFSTFIRFSKMNPFIVAVPAVIAGIVAACAVTAVIVKHFESGKPQEYLSMFSSYTSSVPAVLPETSSEEAPPVAVPVLQPVKKQVEYKGQSINVAEVEVAKPDSKEDSENGNYIQEKPAQAAPAPVELTIIKFRGGNNYTYGIDVSSHNKTSTGRR